MPRPRHRRRWSDSPAYRRADRTLLSVIIGLSALTAATGLTAGAQERPGPGAGLRPVSDTGEAPRRFTGVASWYGARFEGQTTACGHTFDPTALTTAHRRLPCGTRLEVRYSDRSVMVTVTDRGPFVPERVLDLSRAAFAELSPPGEGLIRVRARIVTLTGPS